MKFVIDRCTFNTETSKRVAIASAPLHPSKKTQPSRAIETIDEAVLYRTREGDFFLHSFITEKYEDDQRAVYSHDAEAMTAQEAVIWIQGVGAEVLDAAGLTLPEEA